MSSYIEGVCTTFVCAVSDTAEKGDESDNAQDRDDQAADETCMHSFPPSFRRQFLF